MCTLTRRSIPVKITLKIYRIINEAEVNWHRTIEDKHNKGMQKIFNELGFNQAKHKASFNYLQSLRDNQKVKYSIDFNTLIQQSN